jgi:hypothetical protein
MQRWYNQYWSQCWYKNTFLVNDGQYNQIAQATKTREKEWNNVHDSGCHFTCIGIIIGLDPGQLASEMGNSKKYFTEDKSIEAKNLQGEECYLVWDQNYPFESKKPLDLKGVFHPRLGPADIWLSLDKIVKLKNTSEANKLIEKEHAAYKHIICGTTEHSHLVAGQSDSGEYFLWDPDIKSRNEDEILNGKLTVDQLFSENKRKLIEFWIYSLRLTIYKNMFV